MCWTPPRASQGGEHAKLMTRRPESFIQPKNFSETQRMCTSDASLKQWTSTALILVPFHCQHVQMGLSNVKGRRSPRLVSRCQVVEPHGITQAPQQPLTLGLAWPIAFPEHLLQITGREDCANTEKAIIF